ncbi:hypothetical protein [Streptomyces sp. Go-475]|uniref:hypothetical protein n=1 Tax=Streptomyces sp. Go-475 TaxID=2072505 RepID=UPI000DEF2EF4|nr:hypothetical protein [Streptomyces sp. Go-475]AXE86703.1 hypothetical protein C1703_16990 [Streptomyces sp. Go-475]
MTQSGRGEEPSARPAREGIVLPSDGGEPLLPGMTGGPGDASAGRRPGPVPASAPAEGQTWGQPWGPDQQTPPPPPGQTWQSPQSQQWTTPEPPAWDTRHTPGAQGPGALPPEGTQPPNPYAGQQSSPDHGPYGTPGGAAPLPPEGPAGHGAGLPPTSDPYGTAATGGRLPQPDAYGSQPAPQAGAYGTPAGDDSLPQAGPGSAPGGGPLPQADAYGSPAGDGSLPSAAAGYGAHAGGDLPPGGQAYPTAAYGQAGAGNPLPPAVDPGGNAAGGAPLPPVSGAHGAAAAGAQGSAASPEGATQYLPPVPADGAAAATQYLPPVAPAGDEGATQYIPPVRPGALPPETPAGEDPETTRFLGTGPRAAAGAGPLPPASNPDAEATQYIAPVPGGDKQPPAEFDNLFRHGNGAGSPAGATQQLPRIEQPQPSFGAPQPSHTAPAGGRSRGGRSGSRVPVIAAVGIGIAVLGVGAGALLAGGGDGGDGGDNNKTVAASAPATDGSASPSADPARAQAVELDKLLADSGNSRSTVIRAVADVKGCDNLAQAAKDLRDAAQQRTQLVTRLGGIKVDQLPDHAALTTALTKAWQASASADNHYAAWADQTAGKKGCKKGQARVTGQTQAGNRASGIASAEKTKAARLWNGIARTYGLTERQPTQL